MGRTPQSLSQTLSLFYIYNKVGVCITNSTVSLVPLPLPPHLSFFLLLPSLSLSFILLFPSYPWLFELTIQSRMARMTRIPELQTPVGHCGSSLVLCVFLANNLTTKMYIPFSFKKNKSYTSNIDNLVSKTFPKLLCHGILFIPL